MVNLPNGNVGYLESSSITDQCVEGSILTVGNRNDLLYPNYSFLGSTIVELEPDPALANSWTDGATTTGSPLDFAMYKVGGSILVWDSSFSGIYDIQSNSWSSISTVNQPSSRLDYASVWTGTDLIILKSCELKSKNEISSFSSLKID